MSETDRPITASPKHRAQSHALYQFAADLGFSAEQLTELSADLEAADRATSVDDYKKIGREIAEKIEGWRFAAHVARHERNDAAQQGSNA